MTLPDWIFDGEPSADLERWLGDVFESWVPSRRQLIIRLNGLELTLEAGTPLWRLTPGHFVLGGAPCHAS